MTTVVVIIAFFLLLALGLFLSYKNDQAAREQRAEMAQTQTETKEVLEDTAAVTEELAGHVRQLAEIKDPLALWVTDNLKGPEGLRSGIPNTIAIPLKKQGDPQMLLHVPYWLQQMQQGGFSIAGDGRQDLYGEGKLLYCFENEGERAVVVMDEVAVHPHMVNPTPHLTAEKVNLDDWIDFEGHAEGNQLCGKNILLHVNTDCDTECRSDHFRKIQKYVANSRVEYRYPQVQNEFSMFRPVIRPGIGALLERVKVKANPIPEKILSLSYPQAVVNGTSMTLGTLFEKIVKLVGAGSRFNSVVTGEAGWGKSQLAKYLARLLHVTGVTTVISEEKFPMELTIDRIRERVEDGPVFWIVEDVHRLPLEDLTSVLNFMEGATSPAGLSTMLLYNPKECDADHLRVIQDALERPGRTKIKIETTLLDSARATELKDTIAALMPDLVEKTAWVAKECSLAAVWDHFVLKVEKEIFG